VGTRTVTEKVPVYAGDQEPGEREKAPPLPKTTVEYLKSLDKAREEPEPNTTVEYLKELDEHYDGTFTDISEDSQPTDQNSNLEKVISKINKKLNWLRNKSESVREWIYERLSEVELPPYLSLSAGKTWDYNLFTQGGIVTNTYRPPNLLKFFYMEQNIDLAPSIVITANPDGFVSYNLTSGKGKIRLFDKFKYIFGFSENGISTKTTDNLPSYEIDYIEENYLLRIDRKGITTIYKKQSVDIIDRDESANVIVKKVSTLQCNTRTISLEGILIIGAITVIAWKLGLIYLSGSGTLALLEKVLSGVH
jgi:hypothetical protein